ncbi:DNA polymerase III subunit delta [Prevotella sp. S7-1-8]|uniref:DNA polymerase III subunit n=1 Tax=Prevotella sp. S7-1-8 TaxID=1284775 RepID=UPI00050DDEBF|nr:DNA polymerase III subunit delta' [Prevotella sp. S7-1-8]KGF19063.1 DNA polymerase III subunit delta [Prevotella sp. S7-1-8]
MQFSEVIGQQEACDRLLQLAADGRVPHAMMFTGPKGSGKMALALAFACYLLGERMGELPSTVPLASVANAEAMLAKWQHPDLYFTFPVIRPKGTSSDRQVTSDDFLREWRQMLSESVYFTMDQWMRRMEAENQQAMIYEAESDALNRKLSVKSSQGGYKVCVVWLPERMNLSSANKMLKLLEEPPLNTVFLLVSEEPSRLLETIRSRVQRFEVRGIDSADIARALVERRGIDAEMAGRMARAAGGNWLKAIEEFDADNENRQFFDLFVTLMRKAYMRDLKELKKWSETVAGYGRERQRRMLTYFLRMVRESFVYNFGLADLNYMTRGEESFAQNFARFVNERNVVEMAEKIQRTIRDIGQNANAKIQFFNLATDMIILLKR